MGKIKTFSQFESFSGRLDEELTPALRNKAADIAYHKADASKDPITRKKRLNQAYALSAFPPHVNSLAKKAADMVAKDIIGEHYDASSVKYSLSKNVTTNSAVFSVWTPVTDKGFMRKLGDWWSGETKTTLFEIHYIGGTDVVVRGKYGFESEDLRSYLEDSTIRVLSRLAEEVHKDLGSGVSLSGRLDEELTPGLRNKAAIAAQHKAEQTHSHTKRAKMFNQSDALSAFPPHVNSLAKKAADMVAKDIMGEQYDASKVNHSLTKDVTTNSAYFAVEHPAADAMDKIGRAWRAMDGIGRAGRGTRDEIFDEIFSIYYQGMGDVHVQGDDDKLRDSTIRVLSRLAEEVQKDLDLTS